MIRWFIEMSRYYVTRDFYLWNGKLALVVERVTKKHTDEDIVEGREEKDWTRTEVSFRHIRAGGTGFQTGSLVNSWAVLQDHAKELISDFKSRRPDFERVAAR